MLNNKIVFNFKDYQELDIDGKILKGKRSLNYRNNLFLKSDIQDSTILDIGCNLGQVSIFCINNGAKLALGIDHDYDVIQKAKQFNKYNNVNFICENIDNPFLYTNIPKFDVSFMLSVIGTDGLNNRYGILSKIDSITKKVLYLEGHHFKNFDKEQLMEIILKYTTFKSIEYFGKTYDNKNFENINRPRHLFRCSREQFISNDACIKIDNIINNHEKQKILIIGTKSKIIQFKNDLSSYLNNNNYQNNNNKFINKSNIVHILNDNENIENTQEVSYIIYFNSKSNSKEIYKDINTVFIIDYYNINDISNTFNFKELDNNNRSIDFLKYNIDRIYHIDI